MLLWQRSKRARKCSAERLSGSSIALYRSGRQCWNEVQIRYISHIWNYPTAFLRIRLYQLLWCTIAVSIPVILITEPYHFEYWFALTCIVVIALISKLHLKTVPAVPVTVMVTMLVTMGVFLLVVHPISTSNAEKLVEQAGYTDLYRFKMEFSGTFWTTLIG